jgi:NADP-reducing hydrogenase subunit HndB
MVKSLDELARIKKEAQAMMEVREGKHTTKIIVGMGTCGIAAGARETLGAILDELDKRGIQGVAVTQTGCVGMCEQEPIVEVIKAGQPRVMYGRVDAEKARRIVVQHVVNNNILGDLVISTTK